MKSKATVRRLGEMNAPGESRPKSVRPSESQADICGRSEAKYRLVVDNANEAIVVVQGGRIKFANPKATEISGYSEAELSSRPFTDFIHPEDRRLVAERHLKRLRGEKVPEVCSFRIVDKAGNVKWVEINVVLVSWDGDPATLNFLSDITERKRFEEALMANERFLESVFSSIQDGLSVLDSDLNIIKVNPALEKWHRYNMPLVGKKCYEAYHDRSEPCERCPSLATLRTGAPAYDVVPKSGPNGVNAGWLDLFTFPLYDEESGRLTGVIEYVRDITERKKAEEELKRSVRKLRKMLRSTVKTLASIMEARDPYTAGHQQRVAKLARAIAVGMGLPKEQIHAVYMASVVHDIGKIYIPAEILSAPRQLTPTEMSLIRMHSRYGFDIVRTIDFPWPIDKIVLQHHERIDGSGYPDNLKGEEVAIEARVLAVADVVEAMASHRPYRPALGIDRALEEIAQNRGILYDPDAVDACLDLFSEKDFAFS